MAREPFSLLAKHTAAQHGCVSVPQVAASGVTRQDLHRLERRGVIERAHRSVYRVAGVPESWQSDLMAALLAAGEGAVASHSWAARLHGITRVEVTEQPEVTKPGRVACETSDITAHNTRELERCDITTLQDIPVTSGARTNVDLAGRHSRSEIMAVTDDLIATKATTRSWQYRRARHLFEGRGVVLVIIDITKPGAEDEFWSWLERRFDTDVVRACNLPAPAYNVRLLDKDGLIGIADAVWRFERDVVVEIDGLRFHRLAAERRRDARKANRYALSGRIPLRFTYGDVVDDPAGVAAQVRAALVAAGAPGVGSWSKNG